MASGSRPHRRRCTSHEEREAISILKAAAEDKSGARTIGDRRSGVQAYPHELGLDFTTEQGRKQLAMSHVLGTSGRAAVGIGVAGAGKTGPIAIVVDAHHHAGGESIGVTLAWRQTHGLTYAGVGRNRRSGEIEPDTDRLTNAGIEKSSAFAMTPFLNAVSRWTYQADREDLIVVDEVATIGTHQILQLARILQ